VILDGSCELFVVCYTGYDFDDRETVDEIYLVLPDEHDTYSDVEKMFLALKSRMDSSNIVSIQRLEPVYVQTEDGAGDGVANEPDDSEAVLGLGAHLRESY